MKILLINPYIVSEFPRSLSEPLGLMSIKTYIDTCFTEKVSTEILDLYALGQGQIHMRNNKLIIGMYDEKQVQDKITAFSPDLIGISCNFTNYAQGAFEVVSLAKKASPDSQIVMGGAHVSLDAMNIMKKYPDIDFIVRGEGEIIFRNLVEAIRNNQPDILESIKGICYRQLNKNIVMNPEEQLIPDINILPPIDRTSVDMDFYKRVNTEVFIFAKKTPILTIMTSRGCPYNCIFCSTSLMWKRKWRALTAENVIQEIKTLIQNYGAKEISILDDQFFMDKKRVHAICDYLIEENLDIAFNISSGTSPWLIDERLMHKLKRAGLYRFTFSIESGNKNTLKFIKKPINLDDVKGMIDIANRLGFWTAANFIIGFPYETKEEMLDTIKFASSSNLDFSLILIAKALASTELTEIFKERGSGKRSI